MKNLKVYVIKFFKALNNIYGLISVLIFIGSTITSFINKDDLDFIFKFSTLISISTLFLLIFTSGYKVWLEEYKHTLYDLKLSIEEPKFQLNARTAYLDCKGEISFKLNFFYKAGSDLSITKFSLENEESLYKFFKKDPIKTRFLDCQDNYKGFDTPKKINKSSNEVFFIEFSFEPQDFFDKTEKGRIHQDEPEQIMTFAPLLVNAIDFEVTLVVDYIFEGKKQQERVSSTINLSMLKLYFKEHWIERRWVHAINLIDLQN